MPVVTEGTGLLRMMKTTREGFVADMKNTRGRYHKAGLRSLDTGRWDHCNKMENSHGYVFPKTIGGQERSSLCILVAWCVSHLTATEPCM
jgi:hypothetical protein